MNRWNPAFFRHYINKALLWLAACRRVISLISPWCWNTCTSSVFVEGRGVLLLRPRCLSDISVPSYFIFWHHTVTQLKTPHWGGPFLAFMAGVALLVVHVLWVSHYTHPPPQATLWPLRQENPVLHEMGPLSQYTCHMRCTTLNKGIAVCLFVFCCFCFLLHNNTRQQPIQNQSCYTNSPSQLLFLLQIIVFNVHKVNSSVSGNQLALVSPHDHC